MEKLQVGFPEAGLSWDAWRAAQSKVQYSSKVNGWRDGTGAGAGPRRTDWGVLPDNIGELGGTSGGDITGARRTSKRARAVGTGTDPAVQRDQDLASWLTCDKAAAALAVAADDADGGAFDDRIIAQLEYDLGILHDKRAAIVQALDSESDLGRRVLVLAGGAQWGKGRGDRVNIAGGGMSARAARAIQRYRGVMPSDTSLDEAAAAAAAGIWFEWQCLTALVPVACLSVHRLELFGAVVHFPRGVRPWNGHTFTHLARAGWRAAFNSFTDDRARGFTGDEAGRGLSRAGGAAVLSADDAAACLAIERKSLDHWARDRQGRIFDSGLDPVAVLRRQRRGILQWVAGVLDIGARGRTGQAERARFSVLARLVHGHDIARAARCAGFASGRAALESFRAGRVWHRLKGAIAARVTPTERKLRAIRLHAVRDALRAMRDQRAARDGCGRAVVSPPVARVVQVRAGSVNRTVRLGVVRVSGPAGSRAFHPFSIAGRVFVCGASGVMVAPVIVPSLSGRGSVHPLASAWSAATTARGQAVALAHAARDEIQRQRANRLADFDKGTRGLRAGWLRT